MKVWKGYFLSSPDWDNAISFLPIRPLLFYIHRKCQGSGATNTPTGYFEGPGKAVSEAKDRGLGPEARIGMEIWTGGELLGFELNSATDVQYRMADDARTCWEMDVRTIRHRTRVVCSTENRLTQGRPHNVTVWVLCNDDRSIALWEWNEFDATRLTDYWIVLSRIFQTQVQ